MKKIFIFCLKLFLAITIIYWLYDNEQLTFDSAHNININAKTVQLIGISSTFLFIGAILISFRMWRLLNLLNIKVGAREALRVNLASMSLGLILPGVIGVDALRATYFCLQKPNHKIDVITCIIIDRIIGIYALLLLATIAAVIAKLTVFSVVEDKFMFFLLALLFIFSLAITLIMNPRISKIPPISFLLNHAPAILQETIHSFQTYSKHHIELILWIGVSVISQGITVFSFIIAGILINDNLPVLAHFIFDPIALFFNSIPITPGGLGITESVFAYLYSLNGSNNGPIIALIGRVNQYWVYIVIGLPAIFLTNFKTAENEKGICSKAVENTTERES